MHGHMTWFSSPPPATKANDTATFPAGDRGVIGVSATDQNDALCPSSTSAVGLLAAPGVSITGTYPNNNYVMWSGTSASAAIVAGSAALMRAVDPSLSNGVVVNRIARTADRRHTRANRKRARQHCSRDLMTPALTQSARGHSAIGTAGRLWGRIERRRDHLP